MATEEDAYKHDGTAGSQMHKNIVSLAKDLQQMIDNSELGDIVLQTTEDDHVWACRAILSARSPFFNQKLKNSKKPQLQLPSVTKAALLCVLEFMYTGNVSQYPVTILNVFDVIHAARLVILPSLEEEAMDFFKTKTLPACGSDGARLLSRAVEKLSPVSESDMEKIFRPILERINVSPKNVMDIASRDALLFYLKNTHEGRSIRIRLCEYIRFASVLSWCAGSVSMAAYDMLMQCLPLPVTDSMKRLDQAPLPSCFKMSITNNGTHTSPCVTLFSNKLPSASSLMPHHSEIKSIFVVLLVYIDLFRIHPSILASIIEPLDMVPSQNLLLNVYRFQSIYSELVASLCWSLAFNKHAGNLIVMDGGSLIQKLHNDGQSSIVVSSFCVNPQSRSMFEWDVIIEKGSPGAQFGVGFVCRPPAYAKPSRDTSKKWLGEMAYAWCLGSTGYMFRNGKKFDKQYYPILKEGDVVRVALDMINFSCSFTVNGDKCGVRWGGIPAQVWPAVAIDTPASVRIEVVAEEDKQRLNRLLLDELKLQN